MRDVESQRDGRSGRNLPGYDVGSGRWLLFATCRPGALTRRKAQAQFIGRKGFKVLTRIGRMSRSTKGTPHPSPLPIRWGEGATRNGDGSWAASRKPSSGLFSAFMASLRFHLRIPPISAITVLAGGGRSGGEFTSRVIGQGRGTAETRWTQRGEEVVRASEKWKLTPHPSPLLIRWGVSGSDQNKYHFQHFLN